MFFAVCASAAAVQILRTSAPLYRPKWSKPPRGALQHYFGGGCAGGGCGEHRFRAGRTTAHTQPFFAEPSPYYSANY
jgi:hypothetical protein